MNKIAIISWPQRLSNSFLLPYSAFSLFRQKYSTMLWDDKRLRMELGSQFTVNAICNFHMGAESIRDLLTQNLHGVYEKAEKFQRSVKKRS